MSYASWLHHLALKKGFLMRGAITKGWLWHEKGIIVGKALIEAVAIEEKVSVYPRVIVGNEIINLLSVGMRVLLSQDVDGLSFVNYPKDTRYVDPSFAKPDDIEKIYNVIKAKLNDKDIKDNMRKYSKWHWLATKFGLNMDHLLLLSEFLQRIRLRVAIFLSPLQFV